VTTSQDIDVITFGCRLNAFESEVMRDHARRAGLDRAVIVNTCAVTAEAARQARQTIRRARRENPHAQIIVTGCAAQIEPERFADMSEVDLVLGNEEKMRPASFLHAFVSSNVRMHVQDIMRVTETAPHLIDSFEGRVRAAVQIQNGCDHRCAFCIIPYGRGNSRSVPVGTVIDQVRRFVDSSYYEIVLTGVDLTAYGRDLPGQATLGRLVGQILNHVPDLQRLRLSSIDSIEVDDELFRLITDNERVMPHLHLSLQSGDNLILKRMKRRHTREDAIAFCVSVREARPDVTFGADLMVGFPTETEAMFESTLDLVEACGLTWLHVFPFSPRPGTPAEHMPQVDGGVIKGRARHLREVGAQMVEAHLARYRNRTARVLMETDTHGRLADFTKMRLANPFVAEPGTLMTARFNGFSLEELTGVPAS
jgi:threonylcarbamoyladenosine tRNA methylthiotransferase MtaB